MNCPKCNQPIENPEANIEVSNGSSADNIELVLKCDDRKCRGSFAFFPLEEFTPFEG